MSQLNLYTMCGSSKCTRDAVVQTMTPANTKTHYPIPHSELIDEVEASLEAAGLHTVEEAHALSPDGQRYFGMMQLEFEDEEMDFKTILGLRNSHDKTFSAGLVLGSRVLVCDNLCFSGEIKVQRKHTRTISESLPQLVWDAIGKVSGVRETQMKRIEAYKGYEINDAYAHDIIIQGLDHGAITSTKIPHVLKEWRDPRHEDFKPRTLWSLMNAFTEVLRPGDTSGQAIFSLPKKTQALHFVLGQACGLIEADQNALEEAASDGEQLQN